MPRLYSPVQTPSYFVGRSGREDVAAARAQEVNQRAMLQRQQAFRQYAQTRQAGQMQRQAQRAAQQQQAFQAQQLQADRDFQMQRDRFGAQRDYGMQERRLGAAAEEARLGREFQMDQADVRFGQQQDLAMQEQDYRLQQLDIAAENQYLSTEQQAQIQRERDILVNEMQRAAAAEGRFEQFGYGQMAADAAARRPLSLADQQRMILGDAFQARSQYRAEDIATRGAHLQQKFTRENAERAEHAKREFLELSTEARKEIIGVEAGVQLDFLDRETQDKILFEHEKQFLQNEAEELQYTKQRDREAQKHKDNQLAQELADIDSNQTLDDREKAYLKNQRRADYAHRPLSQFYGDTARDRFERNVHRGEDGTIFSSPPSGPPSVLSPPPPPPIIIEGQPHKPGTTVVVGGRQFLVTRQGLSLIADTPEAIQKKRDDDREDKKFAIAFANHLREKSATVTVEKFGKKTEQPKYTIEEQQQMDRDFKKEWGPKPETSTPAPAGAPGGAADSRQRATSGSGVGTDLPQSDEATGDWGEDPWADPGRAEAMSGYEKLRNQPVNKVWAENQKKLLMAKNSGRDFNDWSPQDQAVFKKVVDDLRSAGTPTGAPQPPKKRRGRFPFPNTIESP